MEVFSSDVFADVFCLRTTDGRTKGVGRSVGWLVWRTSQGDPMAAEETLLPGTFSDIANSLAERSQPRAVRVASMQPGSGRPYPEGERRPWRARATEWVVKPVGRFVSRI